MGTAKPARPVKLIASLLSGDRARIELACAALEPRFGPVDYVSPTLPFGHTDYYAREFGPGLVRIIVTFESLVAPDRLTDIKLETNALELSLAASGRRTVNIDPGYVSEGKLVLATTKDHQHRLYLGKGIYGEVTLRYFDGRFQAWPWTYPDYASPIHLRIFTEIRARYQAQVKSRAGGST